MYSHNSAGMAKRTGERSGDFDSGIFWVTLSLAEYDKSTGPLDSEGNRDSNYGGTEVRCSCHREFDLDLDSMVTLFRKGGSPIRISPIAKDQQPKVSARR
jgi:hypothetical protein